MKHVVQMIREDIEHAECPDFVLMNTGDIRLLLALVAQAEFLAAQLGHFDSLGFGSAKKVLEDWRKIYYSEV